MATWNYKGTKPCLTCGNEFRFKHDCAKYCSASCVPVRAGGPSKPVNPANSKYRFLCEICGKESARNIGGSNTRKGYSNRFCSMACRVDAAALARRPLFCVVRPCNVCGVLARGNSKRCKYCAREHVRQCARQQALPGIARTRAKPRTCGLCSKPYTMAEMGSYRYHCSIQCKRKAANEARLKGRRKLRHSYRGVKGKSWKSIAAYRGVQYETINRRVVFDHHGWRCAICGVTTPRDLMGSNNPKAPTLDHVVAIANGGPHLYSNVQCACRKCNSIKSAGKPRGQMQLLQLNQRVGGVVPY